MITDLRDRNLETIDSKCDVFLHPMERFIATVPFLRVCVLIDEMETRISAKAMDIDAIIPIPSSVII